jgi:hypothetical protein
MECGHGPASHQRRRKSALSLATAFHLKVLPFPLSSRAADSRFASRERNDKACAPLQYRRVKSKGAPGLAFETWDPPNQFPLETPTLLFVIRSEAEGSAVPQTLPGNTESRLATNLSSRPERSVVERSAVVFDLTGFGQGFLRAKRKAAGDGNKLVAGSYAVFTEAHLEDASDGGHE